MKKGLKILGIVIVVICLIVLTTFIPTFNLKSSTMLKYESSNFSIFYEKEDENAVKDIAEKLNSGYSKISESISLTPTYKTEIYVYRNIDEFHIKKYGLLGKIFGPKWYIGDNVENKVIIVSPNNPGTEHDYNSIVDATLHEYVHTLMWNINPKLSKFLNEGMAGYISGNTKSNYIFKSLPNFNDTKISNPIEFGNSGLYPISYTYIEFLDITYGMDKVLELISSTDYNKTFNKSEEEIFNEWIDFLKTNYMSY